MKQKQIKSKKISFSTESQAAHDEAIFYSNEDQNPNSNIVLHTVAKTGKLTDAVDYDSSIKTVKVNNAVTADNATSVIWSNVQGRPVTLRSSKKGSWETDSRTHVLVLPIDLQTSISHPCMIWVCLTIGENNTVSGFLPWTGMPRADIVTPLGLYRSMDSEFKFTSVNVFGQIAGITVGGGSSTLALMLWHNSQSVSSEDRYVPLNLVVTKFEMIITDMFTQAK